MRHPSMVVVLLLLLLLLEQRLAGVFPCRLLRGVIYEETAKIFVNTPCQIVDWSGDLCVDHFKSDCRHANSPSQQ